MQVAERAHRRLVGPGKPLRGCSGIGFVPGIHDLRAIGFLALHARTRQRVLEAVRITELVRDRQLVRAHGSLHVPQARDIERNLQVLRVPRLHAGIVVHRPVVRVVQRDAGPGSDERGDVGQPSPQHARPAELAVVPVHFCPLGPGARHGQGTAEAHAAFLRVRVRPREQVADILAEHRIAAADRKPHGAVAESGALPRCPCIAERVHHRVRLIGRRRHVEVARRHHRARHRPLGTAEGEQIAAESRGERQSAPRHRITRSEGCAERRHSVGRKLLRLDVDGCAGEVTLQVRRERLACRHRLDQRTGEQIERHDLLLRLRTRNARAVERRRGVAVAEPAHEHILAVLDRHAADALHRLRRVAVRALADLLRRDGVDDVRRLPLCIERLGHGAALGQSRHGQGLQLQCRRRDRDVHFGAFAGHDHDAGHGLRAVPDPAYEKRHRPFGNVRQRVAPIHAAQRAHRGANDLDLDVGQSSAGGLIDDPAHDAAGPLRMGNRRSSGGECENQQKTNKT